MQIEEYFPLLMHANFKWLILYNAGANKPTRQATTSHNNSMRVRDLLPGKLTAQTESQG